MRPRRVSACLAGLSVRDPLPLRVVADRESLFDHPVRPVDGIAQLRKRPRRARAAGRLGAGVAVLCLGHLHGQVHAVISEEHTSELQSLMRISYAVFCLKKKNTTYYSYRIIEILHNSKN